MMHRQKADMRLPAPEELPVCRNYDHPKREGALLRHPLFCYSVAPLGIEPKFQV